MQSVSNVGHRRLFAIILTSLVMSLTTSNAAEMKVMVSPGADISNPLIDSEIINDMNLTLALTPNLGSYSFVAAVPVPYPSFCLANTNGTLSDEVDCAEADLATARNTWAADIVILVIDQYGSVEENMVCGQAPFSQFTISESNDDYGYIAIDYPCQQMFGTVASHEVGHILGLEHEAELDPISAFPLPFNHAHITPNGRATVMTAAVNLVTDNMYSNTIASIGPFFELAGNASDANTALVVDYYSWATVAKYREPPPPSCEPYLQISVQACDGLWNNTQVTATLPGYDVTNILYQIKPGGIHSPWPFETIYDGEVSTCPIASTLGRFFASVVMTTAFGESSCGIPVNIDVCEEEGGGFPQF